MITSTSLSIYRNRLKTQDTSLFPIDPHSDFAHCGADYLGASDSPVRPRLVRLPGQAVITLRIGNVFSITIPMALVYPNPFTYLKPGTDIWPNSSASLYWEYFFANDPNRTQIAQSLSVPVTGADAGSKSSPSQYSEIFFHLRTEWPTFRPMPLPA